jgi:hypothetical protein
VEDRVYVIDRVVSPLFSMPITKSILSRSSVSVSPSFCPANAHSDHESIAGPVGAERQPLSRVFSSRGFLRSEKTWAQNGRKTPALWAQREFCGFMERAMWESNPRPKLGKLILERENA